MNWNWADILLATLAVIFALSLLAPLFAKAKTFWPARGDAADEQKEEESWHIRYRLQIMFVSGLGLFITMWYGPSLITDKHIGLLLVLTGIIFYWASNPELKPVWPGRFAVTVIVLGIFFWFSNLVGVAWDDPTSSILAYLPNNWSHQQKVIVAIGATLLSIGLFVALVRGYAFAGFVALVAMVILWSHMQAFPAGATVSRAATVSTTTPSQTQRPTTRPANLVAIADRYADAYSIERRLVYAVIDVESNWNPLAKSDPEGALGLMQLMPQTARELGVSNSLDPEQNVDGGCKYLWQLLNRYNGDVATALIGYHSGPGEADKFAGQALTPELVSQLGPRAQRYVLAVFNRYVSLGTTGGGQFVRTTPQPTTPRNSVIKFSEDGNKITVELVPFDPPEEFNLPYGNWRVERNEDSPLPWAVKNSGAPSTAFKPGEKCRTGNDVLVMPDECLGDTVIFVDGVPGVFDEGDLVPAGNIVVGHNYRKTDKNKKLSSGNYRREIVLRKEEL